MAVAKIPVRRGLRFASRDSGDVAFAIRWGGFTTYWLLIANLPPAPAPISGNQPLLVIFADFTPSIRVGSTAATWASKFFGSTNSVKHFYETISYSKFSLTPAPETNVALSGLVNDGVVSVTLNYPHPDTAITIDDRNRSIVRDALIAADPFVDFAQFDENGDGTIAPTELHIVVIAAGYERSFTASPCGSSVWGHRWGLFGNVAMPALDGTAVGQSYSQFGEWHCADSNGPGNAATIGVMVHELGHDLGLPDLYDIDGSSEGVGNWSLMATGSWNQVELAGDSPAHMDPWSKYFLGWISPTAVTATLSNESISASATSDDVYRLLPGTPLAGEYFLVENRQQVNYDAGLPGAGLLIWHIDTAQRTSNNRDNTHECYPNGPSCTADHYLVALVQADNAFDLEQGNNRGDGGDPWPGTSGKTTFNSSSNPRQQSLQRQRRRSEHIRDRLRRNNHDRDVVGARCDPDSDDCGNGQPSNGRRCHRRNLHGEPNGSRNDRSALTVLYQTAGSQRTGRTIKS